MPALAECPVPVHERTDAELTELCRTGIPGYDPWRDAGTEFRFDVEKARDALCFFANELVFIEGERADSPFLLEPWQAAIVANVFGWVTVAEPALRRYREVFILVARKNGKSPLAAGMALYTLLFDDEPGAQVYSAAADLIQSGIIYRHASEMLLKNPRLSGLCRIHRTFKSIEVPDTISFFRALTADEKTKHGFNVHAVFIDEVHAHPTPDLVRVLTSGTSSRRQPLIVYITTADFERVSICNELHDYATKVRDGAACRASFLPVLYEAARGDDWTKEETWRKANPNLGISKKIEYMREQCETAIARPSARNEFLRLDLDIRTGVHQVWIEMPKWDACRGIADGVTFEQFVQSLVGARCYGGLDLATTRDLVAFALYFPDQHAVLVWFWCPREGAIDRQKRDRVPYIDWSERGLLTLTEGAVADYDKIRLDVRAIAERFHPQVVNYDSWNATQIVNQLVGDGLPMSPMQQGLKSLSPPSKELERLVYSEQFRHGGNEVLRWMATHVQTETDAAGNIKPSKETSREKIDGIVAAVMAIGAYQVDKPDEFIHPTVVAVDGSEPAAEAEKPADPLAAAVAEDALKAPSPERSPEELLGDEDLWE